MNKPMTKQEWFEYLEKTWEAAQKEALAQPEQEPVAWYDAEKDCAYTLSDCEGRAQDDLEPLYLAPPSNPWQGLTDDEIDQGLLRSDYAFKTAEAWRAGVVFAMTKLKEKNT